MGWLTDCHCHPERYAAWIAGNVIEALCFLQDCIAYLVACEGNRWMDREILHSTKTEGYSTYTQYLHIAVNASSICCLYSTYRCAAPPSQPLALSAVSGYGSHHVLLLSISSQGRASIAGNREETQVRRAVQPLHRSTAIPSSDVPQGSWGDEMEHTVKKLPIVLRLHWLTHLKLLCSSVGFSHVTNLLYSHRRAGFYNILQGQDCWLILLISVIVYVKHPIWPVSTIKYEIEI